MTDPDDVKALLGRALDPEPPLVLDRERVLAEGRRGLRARRTAAIGGAAAAVAVVVIGATALSGGVSSLPDQRVQPAGPGSSAAASAPAPPDVVPVSSAPVPTTPTAPPPSARAADLPAWTLSPAEAARLSEALRAADIPWPKPVTALEPHGHAGEWHTFTPANTADMLLLTPEGNRILTIGAQPSSESRAPVGCASARDGAPMPDCTRKRLPDGTVVRVLSSAPPSPGSGPVVLLVTAQRADGTTVEITETSGEGGKWLHKPVMPEETLIRIATIPGLGVSR